MGRLSQFNILAEFTFICFLIRKNKIRTEFFIQYILQLKFNITLVNKQTVGSLFKIKDTFYKSMSLVVVNKYCCPMCGAYYIRSTCRRLYSNKFGGIISCFSLNKKMFYGNNKQNNNNTASLRHLKKK